MAQWLKSREGAVCPLHGEPVRSNGDRYYPRPLPCGRIKAERCEHMGSWHAGRDSASVQCKYKGVQ